MEVYDKKNEIYKFIDNIFSLNRLTISPLLGIKLRKPVNTMCCPLYALLALPAGS